MRLLVSACLLGVHCRYDGESNRLPALEALLEQHDCVPVCPEILGGLPTPRPPAECRGRSVLTQEGANVTDAFLRGAAETLHLAALYRCEAALLKERSPSCGCGHIYDGSFSKTLTRRDGVTAHLLKAKGLRVYGESQLDELLSPRPDKIASEKSS